MRLSKEVSQIEDVFLSSRQVRKRYGGASEMWLWRRLHDDNSGFPKPIYINGRRFWRLSKLVAWERSLAISKAAAADEATNPKQWPRPETSVNGTAPAPKGHIEDGSPRAKRRHTNKD